MASLKLTFPSLRCYCFCLSAGSLRQFDFATEPLGNPP
jgi:hypothetical protein